MNGKCSLVAFSNFNLSEEIRREEKLVASVADAVQQRARTGVHPSSLALTRLGCAPKTGLDAAGEGAASGNRHGNPENAREPPGGRKRQEMQS